MSCFDFFSSDGFVSLDLIRFLCLTFDDVYYEEVHE